MLINARNLDSFLTQGEQTILERWFNIRNHPVTIIVPVSWGVDMWPTIGKRISGMLKVKTPILIDCAAEAPNYEDYLAFINPFIAAGWTKDNFFFLDCALEPLKDLRHSSFPQYMLDHDDTTEILPLAQRNKLFLCLARVARAARVELICNFLSSGLDQDSVITCGSSLDDIQALERMLERSNAPLELYDRFPLVVEDGLIERQSSIWSYPNAFRRCLVNIVLESTIEPQQIKPDSDVVYGDGWTRAVFSEKPYKAFFMGQIPVIMGPAGNVQILRDLGFDLFDDLVDHAYDLEPSVNIRIKKIFETCLKIRQNESAIRSSPGLIDRLKANQQLIPQLHRKRLAQCLVDFNQWWADQEPRAN